MSSPFKDADWFERPENKAVLEELKESSDRTAAIIAGSFLEEQLKFAISKSLVNDAVEFDKIFGLAGPLGAHGSRAKLGYLLGLYSKNIMKDIEAIAKIRNSFAHNFAPASFNLAPTKDICLALRTIDSMTAAHNSEDALDPSYSRKATPLNRGLIFISTSDADENGDLVWSYYTKYILDKEERRTTDPRWRYETCCWIIGAALEEWRIDRPTAPYF